MGRREAEAEEMKINQACWDRELEVSLPDGHSVLYELRVEVFWEDTGWMLKESCKCSKSCLVNKS